MCQPMRVGLRASGLALTHCLALGKLSSEEEVSHTSVDLKTLVRLPKLATDGPTLWRNDPISPRLSPFPKTRPAPAGGVWRSLTAAAETQMFMVFSQVQEGRENFKAYLALEQDGVWQVLVRLENHGGHPGLHVHDWCGTGEPPIGGKSFEAPNRRPKASSWHRHTEVLSRASFWKLALDLFRVIPYGSDQGELL